MTTLFVCDKCNSVDTTIEAYPSRNFVLSNMQCTKCQTGQWHRAFPQLQYKPEKDHVMNRASGIGLG